MYHTYLEQSEHCEKDPLRCHIHNLFMSVMFRDFGQ